MQTHPGWWIGFAAFVLTMLALDLGVFRRRAHSVHFREALTWVGVWVALAMVFNAGIYLGWFGGYAAAERGIKAKEFLAGYLLEESLSVDNIFVFLMLFTYFKVSPAFQHKVLFWGILGALVMRAAFIFAGVELIHRFSWMIYVFGGFLVITGVKMALSSEKQIDPERNPVLRLFRRLMPVTDVYHESRFFVRIDHRLFATPLFVVLLLVETTDVIFAFDSIPAVIAVTHDPFIVYTSNVFAILGLRSLYFAVSGVMDLFHYLVYGLSLVLIFIGVKMLIADVYKIPIEYSLLAIAVVLTASIVASLLRPRRGVPGMPAAVLPRGDPDRVN
ncbi:MAG: putative membrane-bound redox modulator Alx [Phycisphaerae bacterium]|nr:putative membrane-bound redox modulator Alx [Phycisphaerae bacterium]